MGRKGWEEGKIYPHDPLDNMLHNIYNHFVLKTYLYIPDYLEKQINQAVQVQKKSKAEILRQALERGIVSVHNQGTASAEALLKLRELGKQYNLRGPQDSSERIDELLWGKDWSKDE